MVDTGRRIPPFNLSVEGRLLCIQDIYGNRFPPPETTVEFATTDQQHILIFKRAVFATGKTNADGGYVLTSVNHTANVASRDYVLILTNTATGQKHTFKIDPTFHRITAAAFQPRILVGDVQVPWTPVVPVIAKIDGREFKYPAEAAKALAQHFTPFAKPSATIELFRSFAGSPNPDAALDSLLGLIESGAGDPAFISKIKLFLQDASKAFAISLLKLRGPVDAVKLILDKLSNTRFNTEVIPDFMSLRLDLKISKAFGTSSPLLIQLTGRASFCVVLYALGCVLQGTPFTTSASDIGTDHVTTLSP